MSETVKNVTASEQNNDGKKEKNLMQQLEDCRTENQTLREALKDIAVSLVVKEDNYMALHMREVAKQALAETEGE